MTTIGAESAHLSIRSLSKRYKATVALDGVDLDVRRGEFVTLLGASGSGKTTTLQCIAGFVSPSSGSLLLDGVDITTRPAHKRNIGVVFQNYALFPHMTVAENVAYSLRARRAPKEDRKERVAEALRTVRLNGFEDRKPSELSGGQQQRVAIARTIVFRPDVLLMDEPMGALDKSLRESLQLEVMRIHRELGMTVIYVTHDQEEALTMSDRIAIYHSGSILQVGSADDLYERPTSRYVAEFIGESNTFPGTVEPGPGGLALRTDGGQLLALGDAPRMSSGRRAVLVVRPERMSVTARGAEIPEGANHVDGTVRDVVYIGASLKYVIEMAGGETRQVRVPASAVDPVIVRGTSVVMAWQPASGIVFPEPEG
ncbi:ABC transporter ATP-binding protein [Streptomyces colonosanans]|uniref:Spermidine/putrescine import ATP-binding protein PotA n=1 Tax=Streptomyces colonosanans TaxID=1428652 RepID=A0A1S2P3W8_9ACTN|nr:ABC transporter ATP-binding protein [Streptomyces colonosanans]OIJ88420.1 hypothetical protein BIV24_23000 [Streptomyces colonosanans]